MKLLILFMAVVFSVNAQSAIKIAITVDDIPAHGTLPKGMTRYEIAKQYVDILKKHKVPGVYAFVNKGRSDDSEDSLKAIKVWQEAGYTLGNHTWDHPSLNKNPADVFIKAIDLNDEYLKSVSGKADWKYFRYPYLHEGDTLEKRNAVRAHLKEKAYKIAQVTIDFNDWAWNNPYARCVEKNDKKSIEWLKESYLKNATDNMLHSEEVSKKVFKKQIPHILLMHVGALDIQVLDQMLTDYEKKGVEFIPLAEAVKDPIYDIDPGVTLKWGGELQYQVLRGSGKTIKDLGMKPFDEYPEDKLNKICM